MHLLVIGGTVFLGRHIVREALAAGHSVTTLNRGTHNLAEQERVERLISDRESDLSILAGRSFDAVIDCCAYKPEVIARSVEALAKSVRTYVFISSISVYGKFAKHGITEADSVIYSTDGEEPNYGTLKADCEKLLHQKLPDAALTIRPGLIVGAHDQSDRFTYWPARIARGGEVLAPGRPGRAIQLIDVRDLAAWTIKVAEKEARGIYNATGPERPLSMGELLQECIDTIGPKCELRWIDDATLESAGVEEWMQMPLWIPETNAEFAGFMNVNCQKAFDAGLTFRPLKETIADTLAWDKTRDPNAERKAGLSAEREAQILAQCKVH